MLIIRLLLQTIVTAAEQIRANKFRAMLTALGIIIGVASVTAVIAAMTGMRQGVLAEFEGFGARKAWIWGQVPRELRGTMHWDKVRMDLEEISALQDQCDAITLVTPLTNMRWDVRNGDYIQTAVGVTGIWPTWHEIEGRAVTLGRPFNTIDNETRQQVCLINEKAIEELRLDTDPTGDFVLVNGRRFLIIGVVEERVGGGMFGEGESRTEVYIPFGTAEKMNKWRWPYAMAQISSPDKADEAREQMRFVLRKMRRLDPETPDTFGIEILQSHIDRFNNVAAVMTMIAGGIVSVSLLVGGIGIMNIMLVSVSERTREIGLRKAVGAQPAIILLQFLTEAIVLCLAGGLVGVIAGQYLTLGLRSIPGADLEHASIPMWALLFAFGFSASVGVIFGMFPAFKAARLNPIDALRRE